MSGGLRRLAAFGVLLMILAVGVVGSWGGGPDRTARSASGVSDEGWRLPFATLRALEFDVRVWRQPPGALRDSGAGLVILPAVPETLGMEDDAGVNEQGVPLLGELFDPLGYRQFLETGGALILALEPGVETFLVDQLALIEFEGVIPGEADEFRAQTGLDETDLLWHGTESLRVELPPFAFAEPQPGASFAVLARNADERPIVLDLPVGQGRVVLVPGLEWLDNERFGERDHGVFLVRLVEELGGGRDVLFDEFALGRVQLDSKVALATRPAFLWATVCALILSALFLWKTAWVFPFARDPEPDAALSPLVRASSTANLWLRAGKASHLTDTLVEGVLQRVARSLHFDHGRREQVEDSSSAARSQRIGGLVGEIADRVGRSEDASRWQRVLLAASAQSVEIAPEAAAALAEIEASAALVAGRTPAPAGKG